jgi:hypothetical protein
MVPAREYLSHEGMTASRGDGVPCGIWPRDCRLPVASCSRKGDGQSLTEEGHPPSQGTGQEATLDSVQTGRARAAYMSSKRFFIITLRRKLLKFSFVLRQDLICIPGFLAC